MTVEDLLDSELALCEGVKEDMFTLPVMLCLHCIGLSTDCLFRLLTG